LHVVADLFAFQPTGVLTPESHQLNRAYCRWHRYMDTPLLSAAFQVIVGGALVSATKAVVSGH
jgi:hypothetical protein